MKLLVKTLTAVGIVVCLHGVSAIAPTKTLAGQQTAVPSPSQTQLSQISNKPDLSLLANVITVFLKSDYYRTESSMNVNAVIGNTTVTSIAQVQTVAQFPNKFRTEITFAKPGASTQIKTLMVSDGNRVWVYRPDLKQYAIFTYAKFDQLKDNYWIGFSTTVFSQTPLDVKKLVAQGALANTDVLKEVGLERGGLRGGTRTMDNQTFYTYEYTDPNEGYLFSALVEPVSATLKQLQITGKSDGVDVTIVERILSRVAIAPVAANTFTFTPPTGTKKVNSLAIGPL